MERNERVVIPVLLGTALAILLNKKKDLVTILIELVSGVTTALYLAPYLIPYFNMPPEPVAFGIGTAASKLCLAIYKYFGKQDPIYIIQNTPASDGPGGLETQQVKTDV